MADLNFSIGISVPTNNIDIATRKLAEMEAKLKHISTTENKKLLNIGTREINIAEKEIMALKRALDLVKANPALDFTRALNIAFKDMQLNIRGSRGEISHLQQSLKQLNAIEEDSIRVHKRLRDSYEQSGSSMKRFRLATSRALIEGPIYTAAYGAIAIIQNTFREQIKLDETMAKTKITAPEQFEKGAKQVDVYRQSLFNLARETGVSANEAAKANLLFVQAGGLFGKYSEELARATINIAAVSGAPIEETSKNLVALAEATDALQGGPDTINHMASALLAIGNQTATSSEEVANAVKRSGAVFKQAGFDIDEIITYTGVVLAKTQLSGDRIGNSFKSILTNLSTVTKATKGETGVLTSELDKVAKSEGLTLSVFRDANKTQLKSQKEILNDLFNTYQGLQKTIDTLNKKRATGIQLTKQEEDQLHRNQTAQQRIVETVGGKTQITPTQVLLGSKSEIDKQMESIKKAENEIKKAEEERKKTIGFHINELSVAWQQLFDSKAPNAAINVIVDGMTNLIDSIRIATEGGVGFISMLSKVAQIILLIKGQKIAESLAMNLGGATTGKEQTAARLAELREQAGIGFFSRLPVVGDKKARENLTAEEYKEYQNTKAARRAGGTIGEEFEERLKGIKKLRVEQEAYDENIENKTRERARNKELIADKAYDIKSNLTQIGYDENTAQLSKQELHEKYGHLLKKNGEIRANAPVGELSAFADEIHFLKEQIMYSEQSIENRKQENIQLKEEIKNLGDKNKEAKRSIQLDEESLKTNETKIKTEVELNNQLGENARRTAAFKTGMALASAAISSASSVVSIFNQDLSGMTQAGLAAGNIMNSIGASLMMLGPEMAPVALGLMAIGTITDMYFGKKAEEEKKKRNEADRAAFKADQKEQESLAKQKQDDLDAINAKLEEQQRVAENLKRAFSEAWDEAEKLLTADINKSLFGQEKIDQAKKYFDIVRKGQQDILTSGESQVEISRIQTDLNEDLKNVYDPVNAKMAKGFQEYLKALKLDQTKLTSKELDLYRQEYEVIKKQLGVEKEQSQVQKLMLVRSETGGLVYQFKQPEQQASTAGTEQTYDTKTYSGLKTSSSELYMSSIENIFTSLSTISDNIKNAVTSKKSELSKKISDGIEQGTITTQEEIIKMVKDTIGTEGSGDLQNITDIVRGNLGSNVQTATRAARMSNRFTLMDVLSIDAAAGSKEAVQLLQTMQANENISTVGELQGAAATTISGGTLSDLTAAEQSVRDQMAQVNSVLPKALKDVADAGKLLGDSVDDLAAKDGPVAKIKDTLETAKNTWDTFNSGIDTPLKNVKTYFTNFENDIGPSMTNIINALDSAKTRVDNYLNDLKTQATSAAESRTAGSNMSAGLRKIETASSKLEDIGSYGSLANVDYNSPIVSQLQSGTVDYNQTPQEWFLWKMGSIWGGGTDSESITRGIQKIAKYASEGDGTTELNRDSAYNAAVLAAQDIVKIYKSGGFGPVQNTNESSTGERALGTEYVSAWMFTDPNAMGYRYYDSPENTRLLEIATGSPEKGASYVDAASLDTGGYTGDWHNQTGLYKSGKLAVLHQKEIVLNANDTSNLLTSVQIMRDYANKLDVKQGLTSNFTPEKGHAAAPDSYYKGTPKTTIKPSPSSFSYPSFWNKGLYITDYFQSSAGGNPWHRRHQGLDIAASTGTKLPALENSKIQSYGWDPSGGGNILTMTGDSGWRYQYMHLSGLLGNVGSYVNKGTYVALSGASGQVTGPHLHLAVGNSNGRINPVGYLQGLGIHGKGSVGRGISSFETGGYTGNEEGMAYLHKKEVILNKEDTRNVLNAVKIMRKFTTSMKDKIDFKNLSKASGSNQSVTIHSNFPNVSSAEEIKKAFAAMSNEALQYAYRTKTY
jgi:TP901 family phage tail tape measure protein